MNYNELCEQVTASIVAALETGGVGSWSAPWHRNPSLWAPANAHTHNRYSGANVVALALSALDEDHNYESAWWATYRQWTSLGAQVRRGERATSIIKWVPVHRPNMGDADAGSDSSGPGDRSGGRSKLVPRVYSVFNAAQVDSWEPPSATTVAIPERVTAAQEWIDTTGAVIGYGYGHACYRIPRDRIEVPAVDQYDDPVDHVVTVAHELVHWTGHTSRLGRSLGVDTYAAEELVAELGAAFCAARLGLANRPRPDHAQYLASWLYLLRADPKTLFTSAAQAQRALEYLNPPDLNQQPVAGDQPVAASQLGQSQQPIEGAHEVDGQRPGGGACRVGSELPVAPEATAGGVIG